jgi:hypothetical protein
MSLTLIFLIIALVLFGIAAFGVASGRINLVAAGLFFVTLAQVVPSLH